MKTIGIKAIITLERVLYVEVEENITEEEIQSRAEREIILPTNALTLASNALAKVGIKINGLDLTDWEVKNYEYRQLE